jgi:hypothetical protein
VLKVTDECKRAVDAYFDSLRAVDAMNLPEAKKLQMKTNLTKNTVKEAGFKDKMAEFVINSYVSALGTPAINLMSALVKAPLLVAERALVSLLPNNPAKLGESMSLIRGFFEGLAEGVSFAKQGWLEGMPLDTKVNTDVMSGIGKGASLTQPPDADAGFIKQTYQRIARPTERAIAPVITAPTKAGVFVDEYSKAVFRRMQLNALAYRISRTLPDNKLDGLSREEMYNQLRSVDIGDPTKVGHTREWQQQLRKVSPDIADELVNFAKIQTFQADLGAIGNSLLKMRAEHPEITLIVPFIKTPINIFKDALSYTPAVALLRGLRKDLGLTNEEAAARVLLGTGLATMAGWQVVSGNLTGAYPKDPARREAMIAQGIPEYSAKIGDRWYSYSRIEPLASVLGVFSDAAESMIDYGQTPDPDKKGEKLAVDMVAAITKNLASKTFLEGINGLLQAIHDPDRYGGSFINGFATVLVPGALAQFARGTDPVQRDVQSFTDALRNRIPGMRTDLPVRYDILGQERVNPAYGIGGSLGVATRDVESSPLLDELKDVKYQYKAPDRKIRDVELSETDYEKYSKMSGDLVNQQLQNVINDPNYQNYTPSQRKYILEQVSQKARQAATNMMLADKLQNDPEFYAEFIRKRYQKRGVEQ